MLRTTATAFLAALLGGSGMLCAVEFSLSGSIVGKVRSGSGTPQMGATVQLMNRHERVVRKAVTDLEGEFKFDSLPPDNYSIKVNLNTFVPARRSGVQVRAGVTSFLNIQLANLFSTIELVYTAPGQTTLLSDEWKWALRSNASTRPVLRYLPGQNPDWSSSRRQHATFSSTRGVVRVSAGDSGADLYGTSADLGTAFALATSLFGTNELRVSGNLGYATGSGTPTTGFRAGYSRTTGDSAAPNVELTVRQMSARSLAANGFLSNSSESPVLKTMSLKLSDRKEITEELSIDYGAMIESVVFLDRLNVLSPYARVNYELEDLGTVAVAYSSGAPALDLMETSFQGTIDPVLTDELAGLGVFPRVSLAGGNARVQRINTYEVGYQKRWGSRSVNASLFRDDVRDAAFLVGGATSAFAPSEMLPDISSNASILNVGRYQSLGYVVTLTEQFAEGWSVSAGGGASGSIKPGDPASAAADASDLRGNLTVANRAWAHARLSGVIPTSGTRFFAAYMLVPSGALATMHAYLTQNAQIIPGLNLQVRQPLPAFGGLPGRLEIAADLRNLLAEGYVPVTGPDGRALWLIPTPRALRGGVSFVF